jgi:ADP-heptose:LPS heptosyltransferase
LGDTAELIDRLDAVVTIDSAVFHLAAALGKRTFLLPPASPEWRHGLPLPGGASTIPWYGDHVTAHWRVNTRDWANTLARVCETVRHEFA